MSVIFLSARCPIGQLEPSEAAWSVSHRVAGMPNGQEPVEAGTSASQAGQHGYRVAGGLHRWSTSRQVTGLV